MAIEKLGPYQIEDILGRGGMGTVYTARHEDSGERVAVKVLAESLSQDGNFRERFTTEIETLKTLKHPNIVQLLGYGEQDGRLFYSMELVPGLSLQEELQAGRVFLWPEVVQIGIQISTALKHAHDHGVIHRDLKPANLLYTKDGFVKLSDFGIAKLFGATQVTAVGGVVGTADYMAPEQAEGRVVSVRSDLYSLGSVLYALLSGKPPFAAKTLAAVMHGLRFEDPVMLRRRVPDVPEELERIVHQLLEKDPQQRIATARALGNRLRALDHALSSRAKPTGQMPLQDDKEGEDLSLATDGAMFSNLTNEEMANAATAEMTVDLSESELDHLPTQGEETIAPPLDSDEDLYQLQEDAPSSTTPITQFTQVSDEERKRRLSPTDAEAAERWDWVRIGAAGGMVLIVLVVIAAIWLTFRPPPADQLFATIQAVAANGEWEELPRVESEVRTFLARYPDDPRAEQVAQWQQDIEAFQMQRRLEFKARRIGGADYLAPVEQAYLSAMRVRRNSLQLAREKLQQLVDVFEPVESPDEQTERIVQLAQHQLQRVDEFEEQPQADHSQELEELVAWAEANLQAEQLRRFHQGIVGLYDDKPWAEEIVSRSRARLHAEGSVDVGPRE